MLYVVWLPADASAAAALVPDELEAAPGSPVFMNQYVVDDAAQTSNAASDEGFGAYSLTYLGVDLAGLDTEDGTPGRWWFAGMAAGWSIWARTTRPNAPSAGTTCSPCSSIANCGASISASLR